MTPGQTHLPVDSCRDLSGSAIVFKNPCQLQLSPDTIFSCRDRSWVCDDLHRSAVSRGPLALTPRSIPFASSRTRARADCTAWSSWGVGRRATTARPSLGSPTTANVSDRARVRASTKVLRRLRVHACAFANRGRRGPAAGRGTIDDSDDRDLSCSAYMRWDSIAWMRTYANSSMGRGF